MSFLILACIIVNIVYGVLWFFFGKERKVIKTIVFDFPKEISPIEVAHAFEFSGGFTTSCYDSRVVSFNVSSLLYLVAFGMLSKGYVKIVKEKRYKDTYTIRKKHLTAGEINKMKLIEKACYNSLPYEEDEVKYSSPNEYFFGNTQFDYFIEQKSKGYINLNKSYTLPIIIVSFILLFFVWFVATPFVLAGFLAAAGLLVRRTIPLFVKIVVFILTSMFVFMEISPFITFIESVIINLTVMILFLYACTFSQRTKKADEIRSISLGFKEFCKKVDLKRTDRKKYFEKYLPYLAAIDNMPNSYIKSAYEYYKNKELKKNRG